MSEDRGHGDSFQAHTNTHSGNPDCDADQAQKIRFLCLPFFRGNRNSNKVVGRADVWCGVVRCSGKWEICPLQ